MGVAAGVGVGAGVIGGEMQGWAATLEREAMKKAFQNEINKQHEYASQAQGLVNPVLSGPAAMQAGMNSATNTRLGAYNAIGNVPLGPGPNKQSQYNPAVADAYTRLLGGVRAKNLSYSDWAMQQAIQNLTTQQQLDKISNFAGGQAQNVYPQQMYGAQHSLDSLAMAGQAISSIGGAAANYMQFAQQPQQRYGAPVSWPYAPPQGTYYNAQTDQSTIGPIKYW